MDFVTRIIKRTPPRSLLIAAAIVFLIAIGARVAFLATQPVKLAPDSLDYLKLANNIRAHGVFSLEDGPPFTPTIRRAPVYPIFLAAFIRSGEVWIGGVVGAQIVMDAIVAVFVFLLVLTAIPSLRWAVATGVVYALYPGVIYLTPTILSESLFIFLSVAGVLAVVIAFQNDSFKWIALGGILLGLAIQCRSIALPLPFLFSAFLILAPPVSAVSKLLSRRLVHSLLLIGCSALVVAPWAIRSTRLSESLVIVQGAGSALFYVGTRADWNQQDAESAWRKFATEDSLGRRLTMAKEPKELADADRLASELAFQNVRANPLGYLILRLRSFPYLFLTSFDSFTGVHKSFGTAYREGAWFILLLKATLLTGLSLTPTVLGLIGWLASWRAPATALAAVVWTYTAVVNFPIWIEYRYWVPAIPFLLVSATAGLHLLVTKARKQRGQRTNNPILED